MTTTPSMEAIIVLPSLRIPLWSVAVLGPDTATFMKRKHTKQGNIVVSLAGTKRQYHCIRAIADITSSGEQKPMYKCKSK